MYRHQPGTHVTRSLVPSGHLARLNRDHKQKVGSLEISVPEVKSKRIKRVFPTSRFVDKIRTVSVNK